MNLPLTATERLAWDVAYCQARQTVTPLDFHCRSCGQPTGHRCNAPNGAATDIPCWPRISAALNWTAAKREHVERLSTLVELDHRSIGWLLCRQFQSSPQNT